MPSVRRLGCIAAYSLTVALCAAPARADEIWVAPTAQQDLGGLGVASNAVWPVSAFGAVRLAWSVPDNLNALQSAKVVLIPQSPGASSLNVFVCSSKNGDLASGNCTGPSTKPYTAVPNTLMEVEIAGILAPYIGSPGANYLAVIAYTTPTTATDHILGLRFGYEPTKASGVATLAANTFSGTQIAPAFVGDGSGLTGLPFPAGAATLGANTFSGTQTAPAFVGSGAGLTGLPFPAGAATLGANTFGGTQTAPAFAGSGASLTGVAKLTANSFAGTQTIGTGNLELGTSTATTGNLTKNGERFLHSFGVFNTFLGVTAGNFTMTGSHNAAFGTQSLVSNTTGDFNTASGAAALLTNTVGDFNTADGADALRLNTTGWGNTAVGAAALSNHTTGDDNTAVGEQAGIYNRTGSNNVYLGGYVLGNSFEPGESNTMYLGNGQTRTFIAGIRGTTTGVANAVPVVIDSNGQLGTVSSSIRFKEDIHDMADVSGRLLQLRPVTFRYTQAYRDGAKPIQYGLIAEEVAEVFPELAVRGADGQVETVHYETLNVLLLNELQKQQRRVEVLEQQRDEQPQLQRRIEALERLLAELMAERASTSDNGDK